MSSDLLRCSFHCALSPSSQSSLHSFCMDGFLSHFVFAQPGWLLLLPLVPVLLFAGYRKGSRHFLIFPSLRLLGTLATQPKRRPWRPDLLALPLCLIPLILALARPQWQNQYENRKASGIDIIIALDTSYSMEIRDFISPEDRVIRPERRLDAARNVIAAFIENRPDDRIGIVSFAARPYVACSMTLDHEILIDKLGELVTVDSEEEGGTAIGSAIAASATRLEQQQEAKSKIVVLVSDGESQSGELTPEEAAEFAKEIGIRIYTIGIGTENGRLSGGIQLNVGQEFNVETLKNIASITGAEFFRAKNYTGLSEAFQSIDQLEKTEIERESYVVAQELYHWFLGLGLLATLGTLLFQTVNPPPQP